MGVVEDFAELFSGRTDAYGTDEGGCVRVDDARSLSGGDDLRTSAWKGGVELHLNGSNPIGVYPIWERREPNGHPHWFVKWGCVDLDVRTDKKPSGDYSSEDKCHIAAVNLQKTLKHLGVTSWIERTRSCGRHVWVFAETWVSATQMRRALLVASAVAGTSKREINPKSATLSEGSVGNYVRAPFPGALGRALTRQVMLDGAQGTLSLRDFVETALAQRTPIATLSRIASLYKAPERVPIEAIDYVRGEQQYTILFLRLNALAKHLIDKPVDQISDRSMHIEAFVRASKDSGLSASETLTLADDLAARCGKFDGRRDREDQLRRIVERAWT